MKHLDLRSGSASASLKEIAGRSHSVRTDVSFKLTDTTLSIRVEAEDLDMLHLISSVSAPNKDPQLYEEDVIQIAFALPGQATIGDWLVINPHGSRKGSPAALEWSAVPIRHGNGWTITVTLPRPPAPVVGLSLHRYYRGVNHEVHGLGTNLPHPLEPARFAVLILDGSEPAMDADHHFRHQAQVAAQAADQKVAEAIRQRMAITRTRSDFAQLTGLDQAIRLADLRAQCPLQSSERFLCWNEGHFLHALLDLWELTQDQRWIDLALNRMEGVWACRSASAGTSLPTWINDLETGVPCTLVTGVILWPITRLMGLIHANPALADFKNRIRGWVPRAEEALAFHDDEWIAFPDGSGMHIEPYQKGPRRIYTHPSVWGSRINPVNREFFYTLAMMELNRFKHHPEHLRKIRMNALFFKNSSDWAHDRWYGNMKSDAIRPAARISITPLARSNSLPSVPGTASCLPKQTLKKWPPPWRRTFIGSVMSPVILSGVTTRISELPRPCGAGFADFQRLVRFSPTSKRSSPPRWRKTMLFSTDRMAGASAC